MSDTGQAGGRSSVESGQAGGRSSVESGQAGGRSSVESGRAGGRSSLESGAVRVARSSDLQIALRELATVAHDSAAAGTELRSWAVLGEMDRDDAEDLSAADLNAWVVEHDRIGRLAVRLDISKIICVGTSRAVHGLHQGAVMEGSWGDEAILVSDAEEALAILGAQRGPADVVVISGGTEFGLAQLSDRIGG